jgi:hypothetical protein
VGSTASAAAVRLALIGRPVCLTSESGPAAIDSLE